MKPLLLFFVFHFSLFAFSQYTLPSEGISLIGYSEDFAHHSFYKQHTEGKYEEVYLNFKKLPLCEMEEKRNIYCGHNTIETAAWDYREPKKSYTLEELSQKRNLISITELRPTNYHNLQGKHYLIEKKATEKLYFQFVNPYVVRLYTLGKATDSFSPIPLYGVSWRDEKNTDWYPVRGERNEYFSPVVLDFGAGRCIYLLLSHSQGDCAFVPTTVGDQLLYKQSYSPIEVPDTPYQMDEPHYKVDPQAFFWICKGEKQSLVDLLGQNVLGKSYDQILCTGHFITTIDQGKEQVYNSNFVPLDLGQVKKVYYHDYYLEVLNEKGAFYYDQDGRVRKEKPFLVSYGWCGTMGKEARKRQQKIKKYREREKQKEEKRFKRKTARYSLVTPITEHFYEVIYKGKKYYFDRGQMIRYE